MASRTLKTFFSRLTITRSISCSTIAAAKRVPMPPRPKVNEEDIEEAFLKGSGPGGQKINKTSSAVQLKHVPTGIVVKSQATRSREQNRKIARRILAEKLEEMEKGNESRAAKVREKAREKRASKLKKARRKYAKLDDENGEESSLAEGEEEFGDDGDEGDDEDKGEEGEGNDDTFEEEMGKKGDDEEISKHRSEENTGRETKENDALNSPLKKTPGESKKKDRRQRKRFGE